MSYAFSNTLGHNVGCPHPYCKKPGLCREHAAQLPPALLDDLDWQRIERFFRYRLRLNHLTARSPRAAESDAAPVTAGDGPDGRLAPSPGPAAPLPKAVCCVCKVVYRDGVEPVTHGYCQTHFEEAMEAIG